MHIHGEYCRVRKKYYNEDTGKWIGRILPSMTEERKSIRVYDFNIKYEDYFQISLIPRVKYFLTYVYRRMIDEERNEELWVYISSSFQRTILSNSFLDIIDVLEDIGCLLVTKRGSNPYDSRKKKVYFKLDDVYFDSVNTSSKVYSESLKRSLVNSYKKIVSPYEFLQYEVNVFKNHIGVLDHSYDSLFTKRIHRKQYEESGQYLWDTLSKSKYSQISNSIYKGEYIGWSDEKKSKYERGFKKRYKSLLDILNEYDDISDLGSIRLDPFAGRVLNPIILKDREFRSFVSLDGEDTVEVDMSTGYASLLYVISDSLSTGKMGNVDYGTLNKLIDKESNLPYFYLQDFLDVYKMCFGLDSIDFYHYVGIRIVNSLKSKGIFESDDFVLNIGKLIQDKPYRNYIKDLVIRLINSHPDHYTNIRFIGGHYTFREISDIVLTEGVTDMLNHIKTTKIYKDKTRKLWSNSSKLIMEQEVKVMREVQHSLMDSNIPYVSLHDGILVGRSRLPLVQSIVNSVVSKYRFVQFKYKL